MSFDANDPGAGVDGLRRDTWVQVGRAASSLAVTAGGDAA